MHTPIMIAVDAMGGDHAPEAAVEGTLRAAANHPDIRLQLVGRADEINAIIAKHGTNPRITVIDAPEVIETHETPTTAIRQKKKSSLVVGLNAVKDKTADAFVSAGNTGALLTGATVIVGRAEGIERPALGAMLPVKTGHTLLIDSGANVDAKASYLAQFAVMGSAYVRRTQGIAQPRVGLINVGAEKEKGNAMVKEAYALLEQLPDINFIGNVEAREIPYGTVDVAVCDAFVGNVVLKYTEGFAKTMMELIKDGLMSGFLTKCGAILAKPAFAQLKQKFDYKEVGGAPFLGLNALVVKAHGSSDAKAFASAIRQCVHFLSADA